VPASPYIHPEFGFFCPSPRIRRRLRVALGFLAVAGVGATVMAAADRRELHTAATPVDEAFETVPATKNLTPFAAVDPRLTVVEGAHTAADRPPCFSGTLVNLDGNCVSIKLRKPRTVRVTTDRPAVAAVPLGRAALAPTSMIDAALPAASAGRQGDVEKSGQAEPAPVVAAGSTESSQKPVATSKKAQRSARGKSHRRDQYWYGTPSWREVRVDDWGGRGYAPMERDYQRGGYGHQGFYRNFW
jgi:hypothetical protein